MQHPVLLQPPLPTTFPLFPSSPLQGWHVVQSQRALVVGWLHAGGGQSRGGCGLGSGECQLATARAGLNSVRLYRPQRLAPGCTHPRPTALPHHCAMHDGSAVLCRTTAHLHDAAGVRLTAARQRVSIVWPQLIHFAVANNTKICLRAPRSRDEVLVKLHDFMPRHCFDVLHACAVHLTCMKAPGRPRHPPTTKIAHLCPSVHSPYDTPCCKQCICSSGEAVKRAGWVGAARAPASAAAGAQRGMATSWHGRSVPALHTTQLSTLQSRCGVYTLAPPSGSLSCNGADEAAGQRLLPAHVDGARKHGGVVDACETRERVGKVTQAAKGWGARVSGCSQARTQALTSHMNNTHPA